jgi:uncharacterized protein (UPF0264 family)
MIDGLRRGRPAFLVSVTSACEADLALRGGADVIDCKDPAAGALGALDAGKVREIVTLIRGRASVSATIGDLPSDASAMVRATSAMAVTGVDIVKVGFFGDSDPRVAIAALCLEDGLRGRIVAVLMADRDPDFSLIPELAAAGFAGIMLDTSDKASGSLTTALSNDRLQTFIRIARESGLFAGLAGSLKIGDIPGLARLGPNVLGFRGALCAGGRVNALDPMRVFAVRQAFNGARPAVAAREESVA